MPRNSIAKAIGTAVVLLEVAACTSVPLDPPRPQPILGSRSAPILALEGLRFRDLNRDGLVNPYEDWRKAPDARVADLVTRMTLEEKAAVLMHPVMTNDDRFVRQGMISMDTRDGGTPQEMAERNNRAQEIAEGRRLGIPLTISSDPRNGFVGTHGTSVATAGFSKWPDAPGIAAIADLDLTRRFGAIAAQEYRAVGINMILSPQADLATEPRWARVSGTFGEDWKSVAAQAGAYVEGFQGSRAGLVQNGVATIVKHFTGYGAQEDGWDSHNPYGKNSIYPGNRLDDFTAAFRPALAAHTTGVMPTYSIIRAPGYPPVAGGFSPYLLQDVLKRQEGFDGLVLSDFAITKDCSGGCLTGYGPGVSRAVIERGKPWGLENVPRAERIVRAIEAGIDQLGDEEEPQPIIDAVRNGRLPLARIDGIVRKVMLIKFRQGLFENPYVDPARAAAVVGQPAFQSEALNAQRRSLVLLENRNGFLPLKPEGQKVFLRGIDPAVAQAAGLTVVNDLDSADLAIIRLVAPYQQPHKTYPMGYIFHEGDLDFKADNEDLLAVQKAAKKVPVIATIYLERPAILTNVRELTTGLIANFGTSDQALLDVITGRAKPEGRLPFELPSSMEAVNAQKEDVPHDSVAPLYGFGFGLRYR